MCVILVLFKKRGVNTVTEKCESAGLTTNVRGRMSSASIVFATPQLKVYVFANIQSHLEIDLSRSVFEEVINYSAK